MNFIAVDPGVATGIAVFYNNQCIATSTAYAGDGTLERVLMFHPTFDLVVEEGPRNRVHNDAVVSAIEYRLRHCGRSITWVRPTEWKPSPTSTMARLPQVKPSTRHERDALMMGNYHVARMENV